MNCQPLVWVLLAVSLALVFSGGFMAGASWALRKKEEVEREP
jgi:hypothetical protein